MLQVVLTLRYSLLFKMILDERRCVGDVYTAN